MSRPKKPSIAAMLLAMIAAMTILILAITLPAGDAVGQQNTQASDMEGIEAASRDFIAAISAREIRAMDKLWAHKSYVTFMGPLSTTIVVGWDGVRKAWEMRFGQFDRVTISLAESHVHANDNIAWAAGIERVQLLRKNGETLGFDAFVTNVFEEHDNRWLMVSHQATPIFREPK
jgi:ketosteroid isomerase-like protein